MLPRSKLENLAARRLRDWFSISRHIGQKLDYAIFVILAPAVGYFAVDKFLRTTALVHEKEVRVRL